MLGNRRLPGQVVREVLERFGKNALKSKAAYAAFVADGLGQQPPDLEENRGLRRWLAQQVGQEDDLAADARVLGDEDFLETVQPALAFRPSKEISLPSLLMRVADTFDLSLEKLSRRTRIPGVAEARAAFCHLAVHEGGCNGSEIARMLGMSRAGVSIAARRGETVLHERPDIRDKLLD
jgi:hypothetical protein